MEQVTKIIDLIYLAQESGVDLVLNGEQLQLKIPENTNIDPGLLEKIRNNKQLIINFLSKENWKSKRVDKHYNKIETFDRKTISRIPLSFSQERMWFIDQLEGSIQYHVPTVLRLKGELNKEVLIKAFHDVINRHEVLRTVILAEGGQPYQFIRDGGNWQLEMIDSSLYKQEGLQQCIQELLEKPFDLSRDYMIRASLISLSEQEYILVITLHHITSDAWSMPIVLKEIMELYSAYTKNREAKLASLPIQFADYALWQRNSFQGEVLDRKIDYWKTKLEGVVPLQLPTDYLRPPIKGIQGASVDFVIGKKLSDQIQILCKQEGTTLFMTLLSAFKVLLHKYSGQQDICVGTSISNRSQLREIKDIIGFFVNTLALRSEVKSEMSFTEFLQQVRGTTLEALEHQDLSFEKVVENVKTERDASRNALFQVMLVMQNSPEVQDLRLGAVQLSVEEFVHDFAKFDITFFLKETISGLQGMVEYSTNLYSEATIVRMLGHFKELIGSIVKNPHQKLGELSMLTPEEEQQLLYQFNNSKVDYPRDKTIIDLFEEQAAKIPEATAVAFEEEQLNYKQLNEKANQLARYLRSRGVKEETLVPICLDRGLDMIIGILGILKAGGAYVPIDREYPQDRVSYILEDTGAAIAVGSRESQFALQFAGGVEVIEIKNGQSVFSNEPTDNLKTFVGAKRLAYVIYTSGSTGRPKGVMIEHRNLVDYVFGLKQKVQIDQCKSFALVSTMATDLGNTVIYSSLVFGGALHLFSKETISNIENIHNYFRRHNIDCLKIVPSHWKALSNHEQLLLPAKLLVFGGEALQKEVAEQIIFSGSSCRVVNHYGPTETTIGKLLHVVDGGRSYHATIPIGKPFSNTAVYVLSKDLSLCSIGVPGQLYIAGDGVARGYLNNSELTDQKFIQNPFSSQGVSLMYGTGDLVKYLPDGNIEFIGRVDDQVKIRGFRIEPGEIENILQQSELVSQAVVLAKEDNHGNKILVGYVIANGLFDREGIVSFLKNKLPEFMIPSVWIELENFPLIANGKIDRKALPHPDAIERDGNQYQAPRNELESKLASIWQHLLEVEQVGIYDNFFELGGHSLLAIQLISAIRKQLEVEVAIGDVFDYPTIELLATKFNNQSGAAAVPVIKIQSRPERIPLSFSQERLWFIDQLEGSVQYHRPEVLRLKGWLDKDALAFALQMIVNRHEVLRTAIREKDGEAFQYIKDKNLWHLSIIDGAKYRNNVPDLQEHIDDLIKQPFDLAKDDMIRAHLITLNEQENILVVTLHHIASDARSISILRKELTDLYESYVKDKPTVLQPLELQYADYAIWQREHLQGELLDRKLSYWKNKLNGVASLQLPTDYPRPAVQSTRGALSVFTINKELTSGLQQLSMQHGTTLFMTLLAAFKVLLYRYSGQQDICVGTPTAGRQYHEVEDLIGFFVNMLSLRSEVNGDTTFIELLQQVRTLTLEAYEYQEVPFEKVVEAVVKERDMSTPPLFQVMFDVGTESNVSKLQLGELEIFPETFPHNTAKFDLSFSIAQTDLGLKGFVVYNTDLYNEETINKLMAHYKELLSSLVKEPWQQVGKLPMLLPKEVHQLLHQFNDTFVAYPHDKTIIDLFHEQVIKTPDKIAVVFEQDQLTYKQLNERANQVSHYLKSKGLKGEMLVPICMGQSMEMIVAILGIQKAGGAYVPIDPNYPKERIYHMLDDTAAFIAISTKENWQKLKSKEDIEIIKIDEDWPLISLQSLTNPHITVTPDNLAYVIYTSGSTGKAKGVMIEHRNLVDYVFGLNQKLSIDQCKSFGLVSSIATDLGNTVIYSSLLLGGTLYVFSKEAVSNIKYLHKYFQNHTIDCLKIVPSHWKALSNDGKLLLPKKFLVFGGEALDSEVITDIEATQTSCKVINHYGPTETTIGKLLHIVDSNRKYNNTIPIGKPFSNTRVYVLSKQLQPTPIGVPGQLYIEGDGVARGYLNNDKLTNEKFIKNSFNSQDASRIYGTGDIVKYLPDGNIEFIGRADNQVKIRGYRIELGEIEIALQQCEGIIHGVVLAIEDSTGKKQLVGYVMPKGIFNNEGLIAELKKKLPEYMIPARWVEMESFPLTPNGKLDRKALSKPDLNQLSSNKYVAPRNEVEEKLVIIWQELLGISKVSIHDNFFELGGHSLLAMRVISAISKRMDAEVSIKDLFQFTTIKDLGKYIELQTKNSTADLTEFKLLNI